MERGFWGLILFIGCCCFGQDLDLQDSISLNLQKPTAFEADAFGNIYWIENYRELNKWDKNTKRTTHFGNRTLLTNLDVQNSFQIAMQSNQFDLLVLDNQLNPIQDFIASAPVSRFNPSLIQLIDNQWLCAFDPVFSQLVIWDFRKGKEIRRSKMILQETGGEHFKELIFQDEKFYLIGEDRVLVFNYFMVLEEELSIEKNKKWRPLGNLHIYLSDEELKTYNPNNDKLIPLLDKPVDDFSIMGNRLFVLSRGQVYIYIIINSNL